jgi:hypothetical protein
MIDSVVVVFEVIIAVVAGLLALGELVRYVRENAVITTLMELFPGARRVLSELATAAAIISFLFALKTIVEIINLVISIPLAMVVGYALFVAVDGKNRGIKKHHDNVSA